MYDFGSKYAQTYEERCEHCGYSVLISAQQDRNPEYYTEVYVQCPCGESVRFRLPVN